MGDWVKLKADDGHELGAYVATPAGAAVGALVVVQEIFGVNKSIRAVADHYAKQGLIAIAPALFDRFERDVELGYGEADMKRAFVEFYPKLQPDVSLLDIAAAFHYVKQMEKPTGVLGFCYGGLTTWLSATRGEPEDAAGLLRGLLSGRRGQGGGRGAGMPGDAAFWRGGRPYWRGPD